MAKKNTNQLLISLFLVSLSAIFCAVHSATPAPSQDCSSVVLSMTDCLSFVTSGSTVKKPEGGCCSGLKSVLKTAPQCLCETFRNSGQLGISLNMTKAMTLPSACNVKTPSFSNCGLSVAPVGSPAHSPKSHAASPKSSKVLPPSSSSLSPAGAPGTSSTDEPSQITAPAPAPGKSSASLTSLSLAALISVVVVSCSGQFLV